MPRSKERTPQLRRHIIESAIEVLHADGVARFTTRHVAERSSTSVPALYELFGAKAGLLRELFFEGFRRLDAALGLAPVTDAPRADLSAAVAAFRAFANADPELFELMYSSRFDVFAPGPEERAIGDRTRTFLVERVQRVIDASGARHDATDATDVAHVLLATITGLAGQESAGWLGTSDASKARRWALGVSVVLDAIARPDG